jgi:hypothetical protein
VQKKPLQLLVLERSRRNSFSRRRRWAWLQKRTQKSWGVGFGSSPLKQNNGRCAALQTVETKRLWVHGGCMNCTPHNSHFQATNSEIKVCGQALKRPCHCTPHTRTCACTHFALIPQPRGRPHTEAASKMRRALRERGMRWPFPVLGPFPAQPLAVPFGTALSMVHGQCDVTADSHPRANGRGGEFSDEPQTQLKSYWTMCGAIQ